MPVYIQMLEHQIESSPQIDELQAKDLQEEELKVLKTLKEKPGIKIRELYSIVKSKEMPQGGNLPKRLRKLVDYFKKDGAMSRLIKHSLIEEKGDHQWYLTTAGEVLLGYCLSHENLK